MCAVKLLLLFVIVALLLSAWLWKVNAVCDYMLGVNARCADIIRRYADVHNLTDEVVANIDDMIAVWHGIMATPYSKMIWSFKPLVDESFFDGKQLRLLKGTLYE